MKLFLIVLFSLVISFPTQAQFILAGAHGSAGYHHDYSPDLLLHAPLTMNITQDSIDLDINNDGTDDFRINVENNNGGSWYHYVSARITDLSQSEIAITKIDSCLNNCPPIQNMYSYAQAKAFALNDTISNNLMWCDSSAFISFQNFNSSIPNGCGYNCASITEFPLTTAYLGIRLINALDTTLGWIRLKKAHAEGDSLILESFASEVVSTGLESINNSGFTLYPNPVSKSGMINIQSRDFNSSNVKIDLYNIHGKCVRELYNGQSLGKLNHSFDIHDLKSGLYFIRINESRPVKFIKE